MCEAVTLPNGVIGSGSFGVTTRVVLDGEVYVKKEFLSDIKGGILESLAEIDILFRANSDYLVKGIKIYPKGECGPHGAILMENMEGDISQLETFNGRPTETLKLLHDCLAGLVCLHSKGYVHCDIKPENILYKDYSGIRRYKLGDFGLALPIESYQYEEVGGRGTEIFLAPEVSNQRVISRKSDIWSLGVAIFSVFFADFFFLQEDLYYVRGRNLKNWQLGMISKLNSAFADFIGNSPRVNSFTSQERADLGILERVLQKMLVYSLDNRISSEEAYNMVANVYPFSSDPKVCFEDTVFKVNYISTPQNDDFYKQVFCIMFESVLGTMTQNQFWKLRVFSLAHSLFIMYMASINKDIDLEVTMEACMELAKKFFINNTRISYPDLSTEILITLGGKLYISPIFKDVRCAEEMVSRCKLGFEDPPKFFNKLYNKPFTNDNSNCLYDILTDVSYFDL